MSAGGEQLDLLGLPLTVIKEPTMLLPVSFLQ